MGDDRAEGFLGRDMRLGRRERTLAHDIGCRCERPMGHMKSLLARRLWLLSGYPRSVPNSSDFPNSEQDSGIPPDYHTTRHARSAIALDAPPPPPLARAA